MMAFHILFVIYYVYYNLPSRDFGKPRLLNDGAIYFYSQNLRFCIIIEPYGARKPLPIICMLFF